MTPLTELWRETCRVNGARAAIHLASDGTACSVSEIEKRVEAKQLPRSPLVAIDDADPIDFLVTLLAARRQDRVFVPLDRTVSREERESATERFAGASLPAGTAMLKITSGSTGRPRGVALSEENLVAGVRNIVSTMEIGSEDVNLAAISLAHSYGFDSLILPLISQGTPIVVVKGFFPRAVLEAVARFRVSVVPLVPFMYEALAGLDGDWSSVRTCISAAAMLPVELAAAFFGRTGRKIHAFYGSSECGGICYDRSADPVLPAGCVGLPMEGVEVSVDADGRVSARSKAVALGYVPAEAEGGLDRGNFLTADLGRLDEAGRLVLTGRAREVINVAGRKVHPAEIEACLLRLRGVKAAAVVGLEDSRRGESIGVVVAGDDVGEEAVFAHCREHLAAWKVPRRIRLVKSLPCDARGKLSKASVRGLFS